MGYITHPGCVDSYFNNWHAYSTMEDCLAWCDLDTMEREADLPCDDYLYGDCHYVFSHCVCMPGAIAPVDGGVLFVLQSQDCSEAV